MTQVWFYLLICLSGSSCPTQHVASSKAYFSETSCETDAKLIAKSMFLTTGNKYGYRCEATDYDPPKVPK
jgi:hypothetical protein